VEEIEDGFLRSNFGACCNLCRPLLQSSLELSKAATSRIEIEHHSTQDVQRKHKVAVIFIQCIYESGSDNMNEQDLVLVERFLKQNGPLPFPLVATWLNFKSYIGHHEYVKELLEAFMGDYVERVKRGGVATPEMTAQYATLGHLYAVQTLPRLGEIEDAQRFLAMHNNNVLLSRDERQNLLHALDKEIVSIRNEQVLNEDPDQTNVPVSTENGGTTQSQTQTNGSPLTTSVPENMKQDNGASQSQQDNEKQKRRKKKKDNGDAAIVLTQDQALCLGAGTIALIIVASQRNRIGRAISKTAEIFGNALFGNT